MDAQEFLSNFGHFANAPGGISKLRQMIYHLATTGLLLASTRNETDVDSLLSEIASKRELLIREKRYKRILELEAETIRIPDTVVLPNSWRWTRLLDIGEINPRNEAENDQLAAFLPMSGVSQLHSGKILPEIRRWEEIKKGFTHFANGDVAIAKITPCFENGKSAVISDLPCTSGIGAGTTELHVFRPIHPGILPEYVYLYLRSPLFMSNGEQNMTGTAGQKRLPTSYFATRAFPLPPTEDQKLIGAKVDELMALCDNLEVEHQNRRKLQTDLRQATLRSVSEATSPFELSSAWAKLASNMQSLLTVPEDIAELKSFINELAIRGLLNSYRDVASEHSVERMIALFAAAKTCKRMAKIQNPDEPFVLPEGWKWVLFEDLLHGSDSGWSPKCDEVPRRHGEWGVLKVSAVTWGKYQPFENKRLPLSMDPRSECEVRDRDFLLSRANTADLVARSVIVPSKSPPQLMMSDKIVRLGFIDPELKTWANLVNNSRYAREYYRKRATGTSDSMRNVSRQAIHELPIPLPPKPVQNVIMRILDQLIVRCDDLELKISKERSQAKGMAMASFISLTGTTIVRLEDWHLKLPKNELMSSIRVGTPPSVKAHAPLATILSRSDGEMSARDLWQRYGNDDIEAFYAQLKAEVAHGWIQEPAAAEMRELVPPTEN